MKKNMILGIIILVIIIVAAVGLGSKYTNNSTNNSTTYTDGAIAFTYPSDMAQPAYNATSTNNSSSNVWNYTSLSDNTTSVLIGKTNTIPSPLISSNLMLKYLETGYGQTVSNITVSTNPNGVHVYRYAYETNYTNVIYYYMDFANKNNSIVYDISVYGSNETLSQNIANEIFNSIKEN